MWVKIISLDVSASSFMQLVRFHISRVQWQTTETHWQKRVSLLKAACTCCSGTNSQQLPPRYDFRNVMLLVDTDTRCSRWVTSQCVNTPEFCPKCIGKRGWLKSGSALVNASSSGKTAQAEANLWRRVHLGETVSCQHQWPHRQTNTSSSGKSGSAIRFTLSICLQGLLREYLFLYAHYDFI